ncbi:MAG: zinc ribbon domain-containing protein [Methanoregula sp.]|uniref:zinc ribbon domain-containing protein n=1 Tax=Methanoregula sp. TaxID=2052170 RepID=UPI003C148FF8
MKKCPHCGMNIRDNVEVCGYCGGEIPQQPARSAGSKGAQAPQRNIPPRPVQKKAAAPPADEPEQEEGEEEEGGLSAILQPGEQVLIGSLNVSVKKFFFHAYLTNKRIFLIDTQEKKLKVTAKDIPRDTIADSIVEYSENADPVLVLSVKSADDEVKTMKLVFTQNGSDRTGEIDDWISLLSQEPETKKPRRAAPPQKGQEPPAEEEPEEEPEAAPPARPVKFPVRQEELHPARKPLKEHERQPPVKRLIPFAREPEPEPEPEPEVLPQRRVQVRTVEEPPERRVPVARGIPTPVRGDTQLVRKPEVHAAVRTAMNNPVQPVRQASVRPLRSVTTEPVRRSLPEPVREVVPEEIPALRRTVVPEEPADNPQFCHNCGKKLPGEANFCPGCGTRLGRSRTDPAARLSKTIPRPVPAPAVTTTPHQRKVPKIEEVREDEEEEELPPRRPPVKKTPKGSDMTILQKFLRR